MAETRPQTTLSIAVAEGVITPEQADAIRAIRARKNARDEPFTLVNNFGDLFLCLGLLIIYWSMSAVLALVGVEPWIGYLSFAALFWVLAEIFTFRARRKFPAVICAGLVVWLVTRAYISVNENALDWSELFMGGAELGLLGVISAAFAATLLRFRLPILVLGLAVSGSLLAFSYAMRHVEPLAAFYVVAACGAVLIAIGIFLDLKDKQRTGPEHEWALWLFVVGSPLMVHGIMLSVLKDHVAMFALGASSANPDLLVAQFGVVVWTVCGIAFAFTLLGLVLDRRSLVASSLLYFTAVLSYVAFQSGAGLTAVTAAVPLAIGLLVIVLGLAWTPLRHLVLRIVPGTGVFRPPSEV